MELGEQGRERTYIVADLLLGIADGESHLDSRLERKRRSR
jgi:hypothetical protein